MFRDYSIYKDKLSEMGFNRKNMEQGKLMIDFLEDYNIDFQFMKPDYVELKEEKGKGLKIEIDVPGTNGLTLNIVDQETERLLAATEYVEKMDDEEIANTVGLWNQFYREALIEEFYDNEERFDRVVKNAMRDEDHINSYETIATNILNEKMQQGREGAFDLKEMLIKTKIKEMDSVWEVDDYILDNFSAREQEHSEQNGYLIYVDQDSYDIYNFERNYTMEYMEDILAEEYKMTGLGDLGRLSRHATEKGVDIGMASPGQIAILEQEAVVKEYKPLITSARYGGYETWDKKAQDLVHSAIYWYDKTFPYGAEPIEAINVNNKDWGNTVKLNFTTKENKHVVFEAKYKDAIKIDIVINLIEGNRKELEKSSNQIYENNLKTVRENPMDYADLTLTARGQHTIAEEALILEPTNYYYLPEALNNSEFLKPVLEKRPEVYQYLDRELKTDGRLAKTALLKNGMLLSVVPPQMKNKDVTLSAIATSQNQNAYHFVPEHFKEADLIKVYVMGEPQQKRPTTLKEMRANAKKEKENTDATKKQSSINGKEER